MNVGEQTVRWLHDEQLQVDERWSVDIGAGFTWWADKHAQTVEIAGEEKGPGGEIGYVVSVRTDFLRGLSAEPRLLSALNDGVMSHPSLAGAVRDEESGDVCLHSLTRVHEGIHLSSPWGAGPAAGIPRSSNLRWTSTCNSHHRWELLPMGRDSQLSSRTGTNHHCAL